MEKLSRKYYQLASQHVFYRECQNGLQIYYIPKKGFVEKSAILTVKMGSLDSHYIANRRTRQLPAGIAHFLEHQLFLGDNQEDMSQYFTQKGADSNAYTTFDRTSYFVSATESFTEVVKLLQEMVCQPMFTELSINREKDIINQEISMYQDDSDFRLYKGVLANLYPKSLLSEDVAGNTQSIESMSKEKMDLAYELFYHPSNMSLVLVGDFEHKKLDEALSAFQNDLSFSSSMAYKRRDVDLLPVIANSSLLMDVVKPKLGLGFRGRPLRRGSVIKQKLALRLFLHLIFGWTADRYQKWYDAGQIDDSFDFEIEVTDRFQFVMITLDTDEPIAMGNRIRKAIKDVYTSSDFTEENLILLKNEIYGEFIRSLDSIDDTANQFVSYLGRRETYFDLPKLLQQLTLEDVFKIGVQFFEQSDRTEFTIFPK